MIDREAAAERMRRRWDGVRAAREQFAQLPEREQEILRFGFWLAEEEARAIVRAGRSGEDR